MSSIKKNFLYNAAYNLLNICIPLITTPYLSRTLGANGMGVYSYSYSIAHFFVIFIMLGLNNYGCREIAKYRDSRENISRVFWSIYFLQLTLGVFINGLYLSYCFFLADNKIAALILSMYTFSASFDINWFFFGLEDFKLTAVRNLIVKIAKTASIFVFIKNADDIFVYCAIMAGGFLLSQLILWPAIIHKVNFVIPGFHEIIVHVKPNLVLFITVIAVTIFKYMDKVMLGILSDMTEVGYYESAERIISVPTALITALGTVMLPRMTNMLAYKQEGYKEILQKSILFAMFFSSSIGFGIMGISKEFVPLFYGAGYEICIYIYLVLLPSCLFLAFANVIRTQYLLPHHMDRAYIVSALLGAGVNLLINFLLAPSLGAVGVAVGTLTAEMAVCIYQSAMVARKIPIFPYIYTSIPLILSGIIMFIVLYYCVNIPQVSVVSVLGIKIILGMITYFVSLSFFSFIFRVNYPKILRSK